VSHVLRGDLPTAERLLRSALELRPDHPMALNNLAAVLTAQGKPGALPLAQKAAELLPNQPAVMDTLAMALAADRQTEKALELQKKAVEMSPAEPTLRLNLARIAIQAGDKLLARSELERLSSMGDRLPNQAEVQSLLRAL
jgi:Flp pilus assembly protein TadD